MPNLPTDIDATYPDEGSPSRPLHQQHHDSLHALYNELKGSESAAGLATLQAILDGTYAPLASPALTGTPTAPTAAPGTDTTQVANTAFVKGAVDNATSGSPSASVVNTAESTSTTTFADLATPGPSVTIDVPENGVVLVHLTCMAMMATDGTVYAIASVALSGANTLAADDAYSVLVQGARYVRGSMTKLFTGLTPGPTTFTTKYRASTSSATFMRRELVVIPFG